MRRLILVSALAIAAASSPASAQMAVIDKASLAKAIDTAKNTLEAVAQAKAQLAEQQKLFSSMNGTTNISDIGSVLNSDALRGGLPEGVTDIQSYVSDNMNDLGAIGDRAKAIASGSNFSTGSSGTYKDAFELLGKRAARDQALAEYTLETTSDRAEGLSQLNERLATATTQRELSELGARGALETAAAVNESNRIAAVENQRRAEASRRFVESDAAWRRNREERTNAINEALNRAARAAVAKHSEQ